jgi:hypothetical protein
MRCQIKVRMLVYLMVLVIGQSIVIAAAQTPPNTATSTDNAIVHSPGGPSSLSTESPLLQLQLTVAHKAAIVNAVRDEFPNRVSSTGLMATVGAQMPPFIELHVLQDEALAQVPVAKTVKYTTMQKQVVLVDPLTMRVVEILDE